MVILYSTRPQLSSHWMRWVDNHITSWLITFFLRGGSVQTVIYTWSIWRDWRWFECPILGPCTMARFLGETNSLITVFSSQCYVLNLLFFLTNLNYWAPSCSQNHLNINATASILLSKVWSGKMTEKMFSVTLVHFSLHGHSHWYIMVKTECNGK